MTDNRKNNRGTPGRRWASNPKRVTGNIPEFWAGELVRFGNNESDAVRNAIDVALHPVEHESEIISLSSPLPCAIRANTPTGICGKPAQHAHANRYRGTFLPGTWLIMPVCRECALAAAKQYEDKAD